MTMLVSIIRDDDTKNLEQPVCTSTNIKTRKMIPQAIVRFGIPIKNLLQTARVVCGVDVVISSFSYLSSS